MEELLTGNLSFDQLPHAVTVLSKDIRRILSILENPKEPTIEPEKWFDIDELINYHPDRPKKPTVYGWVHDGLIPCHKGAKKLRFLKSEIDAWLMQGRKKTLAETDAEAEDYLKQRR